MLLSHVDGYRTHAHGTELREWLQDPPDMGMGMDTLGWEEAMHVGRDDDLVAPYSPKSNTRNRIFSTICTRNAVSCIGFRRSLACYVMSGIDVADGGVCLRVRYAMSGTAIVYGGICLRVRYAMSGMDTGNAGTTLRAYAMCGTSLLRRAMGLRAVRGGQRPARGRGTCTEIAYGTDIA
eukprot:3940847-Rhodomonas_salina.8